MACQVLISRSSPARLPASPPGRRDNSSRAQPWTRLSLVRLPVGPPSARLFYALPPWGDGRGDPRPSFSVSPSTGHHDRAFRSDGFLEGTAAYSPFSGK